MSSESKQTSIVTTIENNSEETRGMESVTHPSLAKRSSGSLQWTSSRAQNSTAGFANGSNAPIPRVMLQGSHSVTGAENLPFSSPIPDRRLCPVTSIRSRSNQFESDSILLRLLEGTFSFLWNFHA